MANEKNLKPFSKENLERTVKNAKKGGIASGKAKAEKKLIKNIALAMLDSEILKEDYIEDVLRIFPRLERDQVTQSCAMLADLVDIVRKRKKVKNEDGEDEIRPAYKASDRLEAFKLLRDSAGQKPVEKQEVTNIDDKGYLKVVIDGIDISEDK